MQKNSLPEEGELLCAQAWCRIAGTSIWLANNTGQAGKQAKSQLFQILGVTSPQDLLAEDGQIGIGGRDATDEDLKLIAACYLFSGKGEPLDREEELLFQKWQATYPKIAETARKMVDNQQD